MKSLKRPVWLLCLLSIAAATGYAGGRSGGVFLVAPMGGIVTSDVSYAAPGSAGRKTLSDSGPMYALYMMYAHPDITLGGMGHYSKLDSSTENGFMFYGLRYFRPESAVQPMLGFYADYVHIYTRAPAADIAPLLSLRVDTSVWALHPVAGISFRGRAGRVTPFVGFFNEQVDTSMSSEGMRVAGQTRNGFSADTSAVLNYMSAGTKIELALFHCLRLDTKFYWRFTNGEQARFTARNRLDFFLSPRAGISLKYDYFGDKYETNSFLFLGPVFLF